MLAHLVCRLVCLKLKNGVWEILGDLQVTRFRRNRWVNCIHLLDPLNAVPKEIAPSNYHRWTGWMLSRSRNRRYWNLFRIPYNSRLLSYRHPTWQISGIHLTRIFYAIVPTQFLLNMTTTPPKIFDTSWAQFSTLSALNIPIFWPRGPKQTILKLLFKNPLANSYMLQRSFDTSPQVDMAMKLGSKLSLIYDHLRTRPDTPFAMLDALYL